MAESGWLRPWYDDPWQVALAVLYVALGALLAWVILPWSWVSSLGKGDLFTLAGAIATFTTGFIALWLGLKTQLDAKSQAKLHARLVAVDVVAGLSFDLQALDYVLIQARFDATGNARAVADYFAIGLHAQPFDAPPVEVLATLSALSETKALQIALVYGAISELRRGVYEATRGAEGVYPNWPVVTVLWISKLGPVVRDLRDCRDFLFDHLPRAT